MEHQLPGYGLDLPGGQYTVYALYSGDATNAASQSNGISVNITPENSTLGFQPNLYSAATGASLGAGPLFPMDNTSFCKPLPME